MSENSKLHAVLIFTAMRYHFLIIAFIHRRKCANDLTLFCLSPLPTLKFFLFLQPFNSHINLNPKFHMFSRSHTRQRGRHRRNFTTSFRKASMADIVERILQETDEIRQTAVHKEVQLEFDLGNLTGSDINPIDVKKLQRETEPYLTALARDNTQLLINSLWELPTEIVENIKVVKLPAPTTRLPREKPVPKPKALTKWQDYAQKKGINKRKKENLEWDETSKEWKPRWGYRSKNNTENDWMIELPENADPSVDYFAKKKEEKNERVAKNEYQRLRNIAKAHKTKVPGVGVSPAENKSKKEVVKALALAKSATASVGKFTDSLPKETKTPRLGKKRKFEPIIMDANKEKQKNMAILEQITKKQPKLDITKGVNAAIRPKRKHGKKEKGGKGDNIGKVKQGTIKQRRRRRGGKRRNKLKQKKQKSR